MQKWHHKSPSVHHRTTLSCCIFATKACIDNRKKLVKQQYVIHMSAPMSAQYGKLRPINRWDLLASLGHPSKFQRVSHLAFVTALTSLTGGQVNFARCLSVSWAATLYTFSGALAPWQNFARCRIHFTSTSCVLLYWQLYNTALQQWASAKLCGVV